MSEKHGEAALNLVGVWQASFCKAAACLTCSPFIFQHARASSAESNLNPRKFHFSLTWGPSRKDGLRRRTITNLTVNATSQMFANGAYCKPRTGHLRQCDILLYEACEVCDRDRATSSMANPEEENSLKPRCGNMCTLQWYGNDGFCCFRLSPPPSLSSPSLSNLAKRNLHWNFWQMKHSRIMSCRRVWTRWTTCYQIVLPNAF